METAGGLHGHTHIPIAYLEDDGRLETMSPGAGSRLVFEGRRVLLNPGSVGQPRDGIPTASWLLLDTAAGSATWQRTAYDVSAVQAAMTALRPPGAPGRPARVWAVAGSRDDRRAATDHRPQAGRQAHPGRAPPLPLLPLHGARPADGEGGGQRPDHARGPARRRGSSRPCSAGRWPTRRRSASGCRRRRPWRSSAPTRSRHRPTRPRRSSSRSSWPASAAPRSALSIQVAIAIAVLLAIVAFSYRQVCIAYPTGGGSYSVSKANFGRLASLVAASALFIDYTLTVAVSTSSAVEQIASAVPALDPLRVEIGLARDRPDHARQPARASARPATSSRSRPTCSWAAPS